MAIINRWYQILQIMDNYQCIKQKDLANLLQISRQTLSKNIYLLNNELDQIASISTEDGVYELEVFDVSEYEKILAGKLKRESDFNSTTKRLAYILKRLIGQEAIITIDQLSEEMMVSRGTVSNNISTLRKIISDYNVEIIGKTNNGLIISGEELDIRLVYVNYVMEYFPPELVPASVKENLEDYCSINDIPSHITSLLIYAIEASILRVRNNQLLKSINPYYENFIRGTEFFEYIHYIIEENFEISLSAIEMDFIVYPLNVFNQGSGPEKIYNMKKNRPLFNQIIDNVEQMFTIHISKNHFFDVIQYHLTHLTNRLVMKLDMNDIFSKEIAEKYPSSYTIAEEASKIIAKEVGRAVPKVEINYLTLYFEMELSNNGVANKRHIAVVCHTGMGTALIIKNQLQKVIGHDVHITAYSQQVVSDETLDKYFAVFTTIPLRTSRTKVPIIQINSVVNDSFVKEEWRKIEKHSLVSDSKLELVISKVTTNASYIEIISQMSEELVMADLVDDHFKDSVLEREKIKSTIFDPIIGMPHALNFKSKKIILNFRSFDIDTNEVPKFVFLLAIPSNSDEEMNDLLLDVYDFIFRISSDSNMIKKLSNIDSEDTLRQKIMEG